MKRKTLVITVALILALVLIILPACTTNDDDYDENNTPTDPPYEQNNPEDPSAPDEDPIEIIDEEMFVLALGNINIRSTATTEEPNVIGILNKDSKLSLIDRVDNWYKVDYYGAEAYISAITSYTKLLKASEIPEPQKFVLALGNINVRSGPTTSQNNVIGVLSRNSTAELIRVHNSSFYIIKFNGTEAYITSSPSYTIIIDNNQDNRAEKIESIISAGRSVLGVPYEYGSERIIYNNGSLNPRFTGRTFDCSAFVQYAFYIGGGINLKMDSRSQSLEGILVPLNQLERGDLIFMTSTARQYNTGIERIGHVAIYLGNNQILHTFGTGGVRIQTYEGFWSGRAILARRMV